MTPRKTHYEMTKLLTTLSPNEINCIKGMKYIITNLADKDLKILVKILLGNRYNEFIERIKGEINDKNK
jgi:hypothetical protein